MEDDRAPQPVRVADSDAVHHAALLSAAARGSSTAFEALYRAYRPRLRRFLERLTRRPTLADELLNDTMLTVWRKAHTYDGSSKVSTWIFAIGYRKALKARQRLDDPVAENPFAESTSPLPDGELLQLQLNACINSAMRALTPEQRAVVELTYFQGFDYPEIADIVHCPLGTVKTRMFYARRKLERLLAAQLGSRLTEWSDCDSAS